jgi:BirA family transcriptional regulator, biotin operon repressor / biotin---[acetyl-CoA-carboxylase] ligase
VLAEEQTGGRGRLGNSFFSPPGGLYASIVLRPTVEPARAPLIGLAAGLASAEGVRAVADVSPILKWPNDLLVSGRKLSGLLVDLSAGGDGIRFAVLGIGVNVNVPAEAFPLELRDSATSLLRELGYEVSLDGLLTAILAAFESAYRVLLAEGPTSLLRAWREAPNVLGEAVRAFAGGAILEGVAEDVAHDGALLIRLPSGELRRVLAADVHLLRA